MQIVSTESVCRTVFCFKIHFLLANSEILAVILWLQKSLVPKNYSQQSEICIIKCFQTASSAVVTLFIGYALLFWFNVLFDL